ncbi:MAG: hypothetical protein KDA84_11600, partial [Planctomycetaceae bacterium]|nr:hypothetical protein [Planctomycetaceae bacterium]
TAGVGASADFGVLVKTTEALVENGANIKAKKDVRVNAQSDEDIISVAANLQFSGGTAVAGAASSYVAVTETRAAIKENANVQAEGNVVVNAESDALFIQAAGQITGASSVGVGISNALLTHVDLTEAYVGDNATVFAGGTRGGVDVPIQFADARGLIVTADSREQSIAVSFGGSGAGGTSVVGTLIERALVEDTLAYIGKSAKINENNTGADQTVFIAAVSDTELDGGAGVISGAGTVGIGAALDLGLVLKTTEAYIDEATTVQANRDVIVRSESDEVINSLTGNVSFGGTVGIAGAANVFGFFTQTTASIRDNATVTANGNVIVNGEDDMTSRLAQGTLGLSGTVAVGGGTAALVHIDETDAWIGKNARITAKGTKPSYSVS